MNPKRYLLVSVLIGLLIFSGCSGGSSNDSCSNLGLRVEVYEASGRMLAYGTLKKPNTNDTLEADITVNGTPVNPSTATEIKNLKPKDSVLIIATHPSIGTIQRTLTVPATVEGLNCVGGNEALKAWKTRKQDDLTLTFNNGDAVYYRVNVNGSKTSSTNRLWHKSPLTIGKTDSDMLLTSISGLVSIKVQGINYVEIDDPKVSRISEFKVEGFESEPYLEEAGE